MKESVGNEQFSVKLQETHNFLVVKNLAQSVIRVNSEPLFGGEMAIFLMAALSWIMASLASSGDKAMFSSSGFYAVVLIIFLLAVSVFRKRKLSATFDSGSGLVTLNKAGVFGTVLFSSKRELAQKDIKQIVVERFAKGYFGGYGVQLKPISGDKVFITNQNLELEDAQKCAEAVREILKLEEKVLVTG